MPTLNFKKQFVAKILDRTKTQTIRANRKRPFKVGDTLYLKTGFRFKPVALMEVTCIEVLPIVIDEYSITLLHTKWEWKANNFNCPEHDTQDSLMMDRFAKADGFKSWKEMRDWFKSTHGLPFEGQLIEWGE